MVSIGLEAILYNPKRFKIRSHWLRRTPAPRCVRGVLILGVCAMLMLTLTLVKLELKQQSSEIAIASMLYGTIDEYKRAVETHLRYAARQGYPAYILREDLYNGVWNKPVYLMHVIMAELAKGDDGARWIM